MTTEHKPHSELPPVSREALEANLRSTHANLDACIEQRRRLEEQLEAAREALEELRDSTPYDEYGFVKAAVDHGLGLSDEGWNNYDHPRVSSPVSRSPADATPFEQPKMQQVGVAEPAKRPT